MIFNPFLIMTILGFVLSLIHLYWMRNRIVRIDAIKIIFVYQLFFSLGINGLLGFYAHQFMGEETAKYIGWPAANPFQQEVAFANLAFAVMGLCAPFLGMEFWFATTLAVTIWFWGDAFVHINNYFQTGNNAPGNTGMPLYIDIFLPLVFWTLISLILFNKNRQILK